MEREKLRLISFHQEVSYLHLEASEEKRAIKMLEELPNYPQWTPISKLARKIKHSTLSTTSTAVRLWGTMRAEMDDEAGKPQIIAHAPIILLLKEKYNHRNNQQRTKYLSPTIFFKKPQHF
ncbi:MAG: hypothetical protein WCI77_01090 [Candidatus Omnitrophota bacterium]